MMPRTDSDRKMKKTCSNCVSRFICPNNYRVCAGWNDEGLFGDLSSCIFHYRRNLLIGNERLSNLSRRKTGIRRDET